MCTARAPVLTLSARAHRAAARAEIVTHVVQIGLTQSEDLYDSESLASTQVLSPHKASARSHSHPTLPASALPTMSARAMRMLSMPAAGMQQPAPRRALSSIGEVRRLEGSLAVARLQPAARPDTFVSAPQQQRSDGSDGALSDALDGDALRRALYENGLAATHGAMHVSVDTPLTISFAADSQPAAATPIADAARSRTDAAAEPHRIASTFCRAPPSPQQPLSRMSELHALAQSRARLIAATAAARPTKAASKRVRSASPARAEKKKKAASAPSSPVKYGYKKIESHRVVGRANMVTVEWEDGSTIEHNVLDLFEDGMDNEALVKFKSKRARI